MASASDMTPAPLVLEPTLSVAAVTPLPAPPPVSLKKNAAWTILGNGTYATTQWLQVAVIARLGHSVELGYFALALGFCTPVFMLCNLQLRQLQATDACRRHSFGEYLAARISTSIVAVVVLIAIATFSNSFETARLTLALAAYKAFESVSDIYQGYLQQRERMDYVAGSFLMKGLLILSALGVTYRYTQSVFWAVVAMAATQLITLVLYDVAAATSLLAGTRRTDIRETFHSAERPYWNAVALRSLGLRALPLGVAMMLSSLYSSIPRFALSRYTGPAAVGVFAAIGYLPMMGGLLIGAVGTAVAPRMSQYATSNGPAFYMLMAKLAAVAGLVGAAGLALCAAAGRWFLLTLYGSEYAAHADVLLWSMGAAILTYLTSALGFSATALGRLTGQPWAVAISTAALIAASVLLVPKYGLMGAALSTLLSQGVSLFCFVWLVFRRSGNASPSRSASLT